MNSARFTIRARAARDLVHHAEWLRDKAGHDVAERFLASATISFEKLARSPGLGARVSARAPELADAHKWRVDGFPSWLIFDAPRSTGKISILRVLHAAQD